MDPLNFLTEDDLKKFFHCKKTEMSCMEEPHVFLTQLRDHDLVPEELYKKVIKMKCKDRTQGVYQILDWLEKERGQCVKLFWSCVFKNHILQKYSVLRMLRTSLQNGSYKADTELLDEQKLTKKEKDSIRSKEDKENEQTSGRKRKQSTKGTKKPFSNSSLKKPAKRPTFANPLKKGETAAIWTLNFYKTRLPVTCGDKEGTLHRDKLAEGSKCILSEGHCFSTSEFERFARKGYGRTWKQSISCQNTPLQKLIEEGHLQSPSAKRHKNQKNQSIQLPTNSSNEVHEEEEEEDSDQEENFSLPVSCGSLSGTLYKDRFAVSGGKSIRTEERWFTPEEFVKSALPDGHWMRDIVCNGEPLQHLLKEHILQVHPPQCKCRRCHLTNPLDHDNDDVCFICNSSENLTLVCCDECPRAFHHQCHLPVLKEGTLGSNWKCTFCVLKFNQELWISMTSDDALNSSVSESTMHCEYLLLRLYKDDSLQVFTKNPTKEVRGYTRVISKPMWVDRVKTKLQTKVYKRVGEFVGDVRLIFQNCHIFNEDNEFGKYGARLSESFEREFRTIFKIQ
ncbi:uncharacterized protein Hap1MRO34_002728 isoform 1-T3 [Clarias gariepinus]|uniref:nuclear body protein SP140-like n=1 Tax=Clarias gariepinus TaxID=13013 RepID=UPI00234E0C39|nr:nuclear body protein SP140-like [Clarias gariepinus]XP_053345782.1 nuclear body protein SP140-like [Clarias gariepinus]XP_053345783.1 nuclear body protein SP140-like [Clarias gariepinus]